MSSPGREAGPVDGLDQQAAGVLVAGQVGGEAALVADGGRHAPLVQQRLERVVRLHAPAQALREGGRADRHDHELLEVHRVVGVGAAVEHVHHRHREHVGVGPADVAPQRQPRLLGGGVGDGQAHAEHGVGAEVALVRRAVEVDQQQVDGPLVEGLEPLEGVADLVVDVADGPQDAPAHEAVAAVAELRRLELAGGRARRDDGASGGAGREEHLDLDGGVAARVEDLSTGDVLDGRHVGPVAPVAGVADGTAEAGPRAAPIGAPGLR